MLRSCNFKSEKRKKVEEEDRGRHKASNYAGGDINLLAEARSNGRKEAGPSWTCTYIALAHVPINPCTNVFVHSADRLRQKPVCPNHSRQDRDRNRIRFLRLET